MNTRRQSSAASRRGSSVSLSHEAVEAMKANIKKAFKDADGCEGLTVIGENNGWTREDMLEAPHLLTHLEMFLMTFPRIPHIKYFPQLTTVKLLHVGLTSMEDLSSLAQLEELWLTDNYIKQITGLNNMPRLKKLYLQGNQLTSMEGLQHAKHLKELWLCRNQITEVTHLQNLSRLKILWIAGNPITTFENRPFGAFLSRLTELNVAGCQLYRFEDVAQLAVLSCLKRLWFSDPLFGPNPMSKLCNYRTFVLHILSTIEELDYLAVDDEQRKQAHDIFDKKKMYYASRITSAERNFNVILEKIQEAVNERNNTSQQAILDLEEALRPIHSTLTQRKIYGSEADVLLQPEDVFPNSTLENMKSQISRAIGTREVEIQKVLQKNVDAVQNSLRLLHRHKERLALELQTGGNIRLEEGNAQDEWFGLASDAIETQFNKKRFSEYGIHAVKVSRVHKFVSEGLQQRFDHHIRELDVDLSDEKTLKTFLCLSAPSAANDDTQEAFIQHVLGSGIGSSLQCNKKVQEHLRLKDDEQAFPLCDSLFVAQEERLKAMKKKGLLNSMNATDTLPLTDRVILCRAFVGQCTSEESSKGDVSLLNHDIRKARYSGNVRAVYKEDPIHKDESAWYMLDRMLVLPEYLVEFEYVFNTDKGSSRRPSSDLVSTSFTSLSAYDVDNFQQLMHTQFPSVPREDWMDLRNFALPLLEFLCWSQKENTLDRLSREETNKVCEEAESLTKSCLRKLHEREVNAPFSLEILNEHAKAMGVSVEDLSHVFLFQQKINDFPGDLAGELVSLVELDLSRNDISTFSWDSLLRIAPNIQRLTLADNNIKSLSLTSEVVFKSLTMINLNNNLLQSAREFENVRTCFPVLQSLRVEGNYMLTSSHKRILSLISYLSSSLITSKGGTLTQINHFKWEFESQFSIVHLLVDRSIDMTETSVETGDATVPVSVQYLSQYAAGIAMSGTFLCGFNTFSLNQDVVPDRFFEDALKSILSVEPNSRTSFMLSSIIKAIQSNSPLGLDNGKNSKEIFGNGSNGNGNTSARSRSNSLQTNSLPPPSSPVKNLWRSNLDLITTFSYSYSLTNNLDWARSLRNITYLIFPYHCLSDISCLTQMSKLKLINLQGNHLINIPNLGALSSLEILDLSFNNIEAVSSIGILPSLRELNVSGNSITFVDCSYLSQLTKLEKLGMANNLLPSVAEFYALRESSTLKVLDITGNPMNEDLNGQEEVKNYFVFHFKNLKMLNGQTISSSEVQKAASEFAGRMSGDLLAERANVPESKWSTITEIDLSKCALREVAMLNRFPSLHLLLLQKNSLANLETLPVMSHLRALNLANNRLGSAPISNPPLGEALNRLPVLESLSLEANGITDLSRHNLNLPSLVFLNLNGNELQGLESAIDHLPALIELLIDRNKLKSLSSNCFIGNGKLRILSIENNVIRSVEGISKLSRLIHLRAGSNRIADIDALVSHLEKTDLRELNCQGNPIARKSHYRLTIIAQLPKIQILDHQTVSAVERENAISTQRTVPEYVAPANIVMDFGGGDGSGGFGLQLLPSAQGRVAPMNPPGPPATRGRGRGGFRRM